jgi:hypothetical protein
VNADQSNDSPEPTPQIKVTKGTAATNSEKYLQALCERSFLKFWSYPCIYQNDGLLKTGQGKELCDLLVVFGDDVLIFSDKHCEFPNHFDLNIAWTRWFKRAVPAGAKQVYGAERWMRTFPDRLFLDRKCVNPFPLPMPNPRKARFHRIVVAHGASKACTEHFGGGSGSLMIDSKLKVFDSNASVPAVTPFTIGQIDPAKGYVHILDDTTLAILLLTLDTISDFIKYLGKKENLFSTRDVVIAAGEEELLASYLANLNSDEEHDFIFPKDANCVILDEGHWTDFKNHPQRLAQLEANRISYLWDSLIEKFSHHIMGGTQYFTSSLTPNDSERGLRFLAAENRTRRRMLAEGLRHVAKSANREQRYTRIYQGVRTDEPYYVFLALSSARAANETQYREVRRRLTENYLLVCKRKFPNAEDIIGIAVSPTCDEFSSEDLLYLDARDWTPELDAEADAVQNELGILRKPTPTFGTINEYPDLPNRLKANVGMKGNQRNQPCPCGSGRKFKRCCGR